MTRQLAGYNALALGALAVNQAVFALTSPLAHYLAASALGILAGMFLTYTVSGRVIVRKPAGAPPAGHPEHRERVPPPADR